MKQIKIVQSVTDRSDICLKQYLKDISKYPLMSPQEESDLSERIKNKDEQALNKLVQSNLRFVVSVAKQYQCPNLALIDLINEGNIGLINASKKFDPDRGVRFISYAVWWIRQAIVESINLKSKAIRVPLNQNVLIGKVSKAIATFEQRFDRFPSIAEIAEYADITEDKVIETMSYITKTISTDTPFTDDEDSGCLGDTLSSSDEVDSSLIKESKQFDLNDILRNFSDREYDILQMSFGLNGVQEMSFDEIGKRFNMTGERIRQIKEHCVKELRNNYLEELKVLL